MTESIESPTWMASNASQENLAEYSTPRSKGFANHMYPSDNATGKQIIVTIPLDINVAIDNFEGSILVTGRPPSPSGVRVPLAYRRVGPRRREVSALH
jgi:hypothetical protein